MRILIVTSFFPPLNSIASHRPYSWAKHWSEVGHDVTVLTTDKVRNPNSDLDVCMDGFKIVEAPATVLLQRLKRSYSQEPVNPASGSRRSILRRSIDWLRHTTGIFDSCHMPDVTDFWVSKAMKAIQQFQPWDVVVSTAPPFPVHRLARNIRLQGLAKRWIMDYRDLIVGSPVSRGLFPFNRLEAWLERRYVTLSDVVTTVSTGLQKSLLQRYPEALVHVVENGYDAVEVQNISSEPFFPDDGIFRLTYLGYIYPGKRDPKPLFEAIRQLSSNPSHRPLLERLQVLFYGPQMGDVPELIDEYHVSPWVKLGGFVKHRDALRIQRDANALLFLSWADTEVEGILTGKLFEYLSARTPIVAIGAKQPGASEELITEARGGEVLGTDVAAIKNYLIKQLQKPEKCRSDVRQEVLQRYTRQKLAEKMLEICT